MICGSGWKVFLQTFKNGEYELLQAYLTLGNLQRAAAQVGIKSNRKTFDLMENLRFRVAGSLAARDLSLRELL